MNERGTKMLLWCVERVVTCVIMVVMWPLIISGKLHDDNERNRR